MDKKEKIPTFKKGGIVSKDFKIPLGCYEPIIPEDKVGEHIKILMNEDGILEPLTIKEMKKLIEKILKEWKL